MLLKYVKCILEPELNKLFKLLYYLDLFWDTNMFNMFLSMCVDKQNLFLTMCMSLTFWFI